MKKARHSRGARLRANPESRDIIHFWIPGSRRRGAPRNDEVVNDG
jgi:hypothetical protein